MANLGVYMQNSGRRTQSGSSRRLPLLDDEKLDEDVTITNGKLHLEETVVNEARQKDVDARTSEFGDVICQEPGLTNYIELFIDTGRGALPISQRPYNTPIFSMRLSAQRLTGFLRKVM